LAEGLKTNRTLKAIYIGNNDIGAKAAGTLAAAIEASPNLEIIDVQDNRIKDEGFSKLAHGIRKQGKVTKYQNFTIFLIFQF
jgi:Ran GTPase-activating protein (RanGAP) involved in mRNA processing and transport